MTWLDADLSRRHFFGLVLLAASSSAGCTDSGKTSATTDPGDGSASSNARDAGPDASLGAGLVLTFSPEMIAPESEPGLDGKGYFRVQVFDTAAPSANAEALYEETLPHDFEAGAELSVFELPSRTIALSGAPGTVYVRATFFDNAPSSRESAGSLSWGTWLGGMDLSQGFSRTSTLTAVSLNAAGLTPHELPLFALRRVAVTVANTATPLGDGEGSLSVTLSRVEELPPRAATYGYGIAPCVDLKTGQHTIDVQLVGSGKYYVAAFFDDLGIQTPGQTPPGTLLSVRNPDLAAGTASFDEITLSPGQYSGELSVDLGFVVPLPSHAGAPGPNSCRDLGYARDD